MRIYNKKRHHVEALERRALLTVIRQKAAKEREQQRRMDECLATAEANPNN
jgi:hypothetical protein